ncbi:trifunctional serine/threonine-protein kinase/ATP-binding protein/sensor histidine kinase [Microcoleus vaginatus]|uniref:trifunctional serine/threonine-protein kinase/ATP-binding protein/sensor histidine kinase n=1 Tax=Microcoleus vaginatus TaxID=119532 RepID=UPI001F5FF5B7|nr:GAF domain-containing protein [Microcoleus vaginatus HSN003]
MIELTGYQILDRIYSGTRTLVYRGTRLYDRKPVAIKVLRNEYPSFSELLHFRNQYTIAKNLNLPGIIQTYSLEAYRNGYALIVEDFGGISLKEWTGKGKTVPSLVDFFQIAIDLSNTLDILYRHRIIHKDIKPANILINPKTKQVKLIDFSIASLLPRETQIVMSPNVIEGTLSYLSPEQTGRMNRGLDYRTDFYSLGVTFYELLTGKLPFQSSDPMELIHYHIAHHPPSVREINPKIPLVLSEIVSKLMAKNAETRYQSALGLKADLKTCWQQLNETGKIESFAIGRRDFCDRFIIPEKLYGRATEVAALLAAFDRVANPSNSHDPEEPGNERNEEKEDSPLTKDGGGDSNLSHSEMMLVAGFSGIGKTAVVNEIHKPIVRQRGYFIKGKYDQFQRNIPFSAFVQAFRDLMEQLLSESDAQLERWQRKIINALGENGQVIVEVIPELERIIGKQQPVSELSGSAAENRFNLLFQKFISVFATKEHPLVIFLDDLQWSDSASLKLLQVLMSEKNSQNLLVIGAYRDNEVSPAHPFMLAVAEMEKSQVTVNTITLEPLSQTDINDLIADTLSCEILLAQPLTELVYQKTKGNPFFATQFLRALQEDGLIAFDPTPLSQGRERGVRGGWQCDIAKVKALTITDDVVEFMAVQLQKLPPETQDVLKLAACIGAHFDLNTLAVVSEKSPEETAADLWKSLQEGFILPTSEIYKFYLGKEERTTSSALPTPAAQLPHYKFLHDRVQQAAYSLIPENQKQATHLKIGQLLLPTFSEVERGEEVFDIINHYIISSDLITQQEERTKLAKISLFAGHRAKLSTAYESATKYLAFGLSFLPSNKWKSLYQLTFIMYLESLETEFLAGNFEEAEKLIKIAFKNAKTSLDKSKIIAVQLTHYQNKALYQKAIQVGIEGLKLLGLELAIMPQEAELEGMALEVKKTLNQRAVAGLIDAPLIVDEERQMLIKLLMNMVPPTYLTNQELLVLVVLHMTNLCLQYGNTNVAGFVYVWYGTILCQRFQDYELGYEFGLLGLNVNEKFNNTTLNGKIYMSFGNFINHWRKHVSSNLDLQQAAYQGAMEVGDFSWCHHSALFSFWQQAIVSSDIHSLLARHEKYISFAERTEITTAFALILQCNLLENLQGLTIGKYSLSSETFDEESALATFNEIGYGYGSSTYYFAKAFLFFTYGEYAKAYEMLVAAAEFSNALYGQFQRILHCFYQSLTVLQLYGLATPKEQKDYQEFLHNNRAQLQIWAHNCPENCLSKFLLLEAEMARVAEQKWQAAELYDRAIVLAQENQFLNEEALANELGAKFYLGCGKEKVAAGYMQEAYYCYARWGAKAKTDDLEQRYPDLLRPILQQCAQPLTILETLSTLTNPTYSIHSSTHHTTSSTSINQALDFTTLLEISQMISSTIDLDELLQIVTQTMLQNSGADRCALMLCQHQQWQVRAIATWENISLQREPLENNPTVPVKLIQYVKNTLATVAIDHLKTDLPVIDDYLEHHKPESFLGLPILNQGNLVGILYLENRITSGVFSRDRLLVLNFLSSQAAIALENARLYHQVQQTLNELQQTQMQMIQSEKMSALGNLVAGVAHEINNPVGFIAGNINEAHAGVQDLIDYLRLYQEKYPPSEAELIKKAEEIDLDYLVEDLPKMLSSMKIGCERIKNISTSLRTFSRADTAHKVEANIHEGLNSTLMILRHRLKASDKHPEIEIIKEYGKIPKVKCYLGQLNQVFMNLLANAIDALEESNQGRSFAEINAHPNHITIRTKVESEKVKISIADNGKGMSEDVKNRIFDHLFTTKDVGKGTGLGLAIARQIVEEKHGGKLSCFSTPGEGTEFVIEILID